MKKTTLLKTLALSVFLLFTLSCKKDEPEIAPEMPVYQTITIDEAKAWFEQSGGSSDVIEGSIDASPDGLKGARKGYKKHKPKWDKAVQKRFKNNDTYVQVPLEDSIVINRVVYDSTTKQYYPIPELQLIVFKDKKGKEQSEVMDLQPTGAYAREHPGYSEDTGYSGFQLFFSMEGDPLVGYRYENGRQIAQLTPETKGGRTAACVRYVYANYTNSCYTFNGQLTVVGQSVLVQEGYEWDVQPGEPCCYNSCDGWRLSSTTFAYQVCDPGTGGGGGTGGGTGSGSGSVEANFVFYAPEKPIYNINDYFKCFTNTSFNRYKVTIYVKQPVKGSRTKASVSNKAGHVFMVLEQKPILILASTKTIRRSVGFYPAEGANIADPSSPGILNNDSGEPYDVSLSINLGANSFFTLLGETKNWSSKGYNLNTANCTDMCISTLKRIGINLPDTQGSWGIASGSNPADLGEDIRQMQLNSSMTRNTTGGTSPSNLGSCQ